MSSPSFQKAQNDRRKRSAKGEIGRVVFTFPKGHFVGTVSREGYGKHSFSSFFSLFLILSQIIVKSKKKEEPF
jgi:hypothetical protein